MDFNFETIDYNVFIEKFRESKTASLLKTIYTTTAENISDCIFDFPSIPNTTEFTICTDTYFDVLMLGYPNKFSIFTRQLTLHENSYSGVRKFNLERKHKGKSIIEEKLFYKVSTFILFSQMLCTKPATKNENDSPSFRVLNILFHIIFNLIKSNSFVPTIYKKENENTFLCYQVLTTSNSVKDALLIYTELFRKSFQITKTYNPIDILNYFLTAIITYTTNFRHIFYETEADFKYIIHTLILNDSSIENDICNLNKQIIADFKEFTTSPPPTIEVNEYLPPIGFGNN
ncbi:MAG: hypothetical protein HQL06_08840 [Nitrospirae bacterium]|nr:hypothetical protein [Nitrospirota bacterium]